MNEKTRIEKIMQVEGMTSGQFAQEIGVQNSTLSHILNNRNNPSLDVIKKILNRFPVVNADWLILGQGPMFRQELHSQMPTLFGFDDESDSLSIGSSENTTKNSHLDFSSKEKNIMPSSPKVPIMSIVQKSESMSNQQSHSTPVDDTNDLISQKTSDNQEAKSDLKDDNLQFIEKKASKIILYYTDNTFQEFESK